MRLINKFSCLIGLILSAASVTHIFAALEVNDLQFQDAIVQLEEFVKIPSLSKETHPDFSMPNLMKAAEFAGSGLADLGFRVDYVRVENCAPYVVAEQIIDPKKPTITLYAHYDIQPVDLEKWATDPFVAFQKDGRLYARGASDDKAGVIAIMTALRVYRDAGMELPVNVRVLLEGEEEYSSSHMEAFLEQMGDQLDADALVVLDGLNRAVDCATLTSSTRGSVNITATVTALNQPIHSGIGCLAPDPALALATLLSSLADPREIPGFMAGFCEMSPEERQMYSKTSQSAQQYVEELGIVPSSTLRGDPHLSIDERIVEEPSITILNMTAGQPGGSNSIQDRAECTIGIRVLPGQDPDAIASAVMDHLRSQPMLYQLPLELVATKGGWPWKANVASGFSNLYFQALEENFPQVAAAPCGGALPLLYYFTKQFPRMEVIVPAVEDPATAAHSHNESQDLNLLRCAINSLISFLDKAGEYTSEET